MNKYIAFTQMIILTTQQLLLAPSPYLQCKYVLPADAQVLHRLHRGSYFCNASSNSAMPALSSAANIVFPVDLITLFSIIGTIPTPGFTVSAWHESSIGSLPSQTFIGSFAIRFPQLSFSACALIFVHSFSNYSIIFASLPD